MLTLRSVRNLAICTSCRQTVRVLSGTAFPKGHNTSASSRISQCQRGMYSSMQTQGAALPESANIDHTGDIVHHPRLEVQRVPALSDNYVWLLTEPSTGQVAVVDPSEAKPVQQALEQRGLKLNTILNTHHHFDHTGGNQELKQHYKCAIVGPKADESRIPGIDVALADSDTWQFGDLTMHVYDTPGHTRGHISLFFPEAEALFPGDTLFVLGCGRLFEGSPAEMWASLSKFLPLPPSTRVFCAHEYTQSNAKFALHANPKSQAMQGRRREIDQMRSQGVATVPSLLGQELALNPFLRPNDPSIRAALGISPDASDDDAFAAIRHAKDNF